MDVQNEMNPPVRSAGLLGQDDKEILSFNILSFISLSPFTRIVLTVTSLSDSKELPIEYSIEFTEGHSAEIPFIFLVRSKG